jgi:uncharacterized protein with PIN domain
VFAGADAALAVLAVPSLVPSELQKRFVSFSLKRVFAIEIERCLRCGGRLRVIASIEDEAVIERILDHLGSQDEAFDLSHPSRAPPGGQLL